MLVLKMDTVSTMAANPENEVKKRSVTKRCFRITENSESQTPAGRNQVQNSLIEKPVLCFNLCFWTSVWLFPEKLLLAIVPPLIFAAQ
jgi:hypothetical protein